MAKSVWNKVAAETRVSIHRVRGKSGCRAVEMTVSLERACRILMALIQPLLQDPLESLAQRKTRKYAETS